MIEQPCTYVCMNIHHTRTGMGSWHVRTGIVHTEIHTCSDYNAQLSASH